VGLPIVLPRSEHTLSRRDIDPDALKVMYRLQQLGHTAYLVGGSVRDLLLGRRPKDFDIGTSAMPHEIKRGFRNCWIIGRRFRLAHVKFGTKTIEVATFRRQIRLDAAEEEAARHVAEGAGNGNAGGNGGDAGNGDANGNVSAAAHANAESRMTEPNGNVAPPSRDLLIERDNAYGTPEEDAFRRDFTINGLFYDPAERSVIDYVGGIEDLRAGIVRSIGDPMLRFQEDPVRMLRAIVMSERLEFKLDPLVIDAIDRLGSHIRHAAPARLLEEYFKILRSGAAERVFQGLARAGLIEHISPEMEEGLGEEFFESLSRLDAYRLKFDTAPETLTNTILLGSLLVPLGMMDQAHRRYGISQQWYPALGRLPVPRKDVERLTHLLSLQPRLSDLDAPPRAQQSLVHRGIFRDALTWFEIYGDHPAAVRHWHALRNDTPPLLHGPNGHPVDMADDDQRRRRRRRRRRSYRTPLQP
jgi:tRNA nucleotidyltransferase/poly(A) polymerase